MLVVGDKERQNGTVAVRRHKAGDQGSQATADVIRMLRENVDAKAITP
jgi:threonyl-tRNA synthetase